MIPTVQMWFRRSYGVNVSIRKMEENDIHVKAGCASLVSTDSYILSEFAGFDEIRILDATDRSGILYVATGQQQCLKGRTDNIHASFSFGFVVLLSHILLI